MSNFPADFFISAFLKIRSLFDLEHEHQYKDSARVMHINASENNSWQKHPL